MSDATSHGAAGIAYAPGGPTEADLRLCGDLAARRVLDLGCGDGANAIAMALAGARVTALDASGSHLDAARAAAEAAEVKVEWRRGDPADVAFAPPASVDLAFSALALDAADDLSRVFRQVHRVLKPGAPLVLSLTHPVARMFDGDRLVRAYGADGRGIGALFATLARANFSVDALREPVQPGAAIPTVLVLRGRKLGT